MVFQYIKEKWRRINSNYKTYILAAIVLLIAMILSFTAFDKIAFVTFTVAYVLFGFGFILSIVPILEDYWTNSYCRWMWGVFHLFILVASAAIARELVSSALGLPPQDFDLTVSLFTLILYIPTLTTAFAIFTIIFSVILLPLWLVAAMTNDPLVDHGLNLLSRISSHSIFGRILSSKIRSQVAWKGFFHNIGAVVIGSALCFPIMSYAKYQEKLFPFVRYTAFLCDFKPALNYPTVSANERIILHENGVISSATVTGNGVQVNVRMFESSAPNTVAGAVKPHSP